MGSWLGRLVGVGALLAVGALSVVGAVGGVALGAAEEEAAVTRTVALGAATSARVEVALENGRLLLAGGSLAGAGEPMPRGQLLRGQFTSTESAAEPDVEYAVEDGAGRLRLAQPGADAAFPWSARTDDWSLFLNPTVPTDLRVEVGAGESALVLGGLTLTGLDVAAGAGSTTIDFGGDWRTDLSGRVASGAGDLTLRVPRGVGARIELGNNEGAVEAEGFTDDGGVYVNDAFGSAPVTLDLRVDQGAGTLVLESVG
ncbi:MAG: toast rack family protein [Chloroflexota bacterium]|nr:toast rack family protein [Chloroflexota bacterium]